MTEAASTHIVRQATEQDLNDIVSVLRAAHAEFEPVVPVRFFGPYLANVLDITSRLHMSELYVAERVTDGAIVGTIGLYLRAADEGRGWPPGFTGIRGVAVDPLQRRRGLGKQLAEACIARSRELRADAAVLHTASFMKAAMALYESIGFRRAPEFDQDAAELVGAEPTRPTIVALAYRLELGES